MTQNKTLRAVIVDDEQPARELLRRLLTAKHITIAAECSNGKEAVTAIAKHDPDVVLLDIQMPGMDGFQVIEAVGADNMPPIIFVTAYDQHALRAFEVNAIDYLLKPFSLQRFSRALQRVQKPADRSLPKRNVRLRRMIEYWRQPVASPKPENANHYLQRLSIQEGKRLMIIPVEDIDWIKSADHYLTVSSKRKTYLIYDKMAAIETRLDPSTFVRIHRSTIVRVKAVKQVRRAFYGSYTVAMNDGSEFPVSRSRYAYLAKLLASLS